MIRVILAGILGGIVIFGCGVVEHAVLQLQSRAIRTLPAPAEKQIIDLMLEHDLEHAVYSFPSPPFSASEEEKKKLTEEWNAKYSRGLNGMFFIGRSGEEPMSLRMMGFEFASNFVSALLCCYILALLAPQIGFSTRLAVCFSIGLIASLSIDASYSIWYRFPIYWMTDGLICSLAEWLIAGVVMSAIVKPFYPESVVALAK